jgi:hypothetical protein
MPSPTKHFKFFLTCTATSKAGLPHQGQVLLSLTDCKEIEAQRNVRDFPEIKKLNIAQLGFEVRSLSHIQFLHYSTLKAGQLGAV